MKLYRIHPTPDTPHLVTIATEGDAAHALEVARGNPWVGPQLTDTAYAEEVEELFE